MLLGTATITDPNLTNALSQVVTYFTSNINPVITAVVGLAMFIWLLKIALRSFGITSIEGGIFDDGENIGIRLEAFGDEEDDAEERYYGGRWDL